MIIAFALQLKLMSHLTKTLTVSLKIILLLIVRGRQGTQYGALSRFYNSNSITFRGFIASNGS